MPPKKQILCREESMVPPSQIQALHGTNVRKEGNY